MLWENVTSTSTAEKQPGSACCPEVIGGEWVGDAGRELPADFKVKSHRHRKWTALKRNIKKKIFYIHCTYHIGNKETNYSHSNV